jgi:F-type H+-transporting ATPase subunit gamma
MSLKKNVFCFNFQMKRSKKQLFYKGSMSQIVQLRQKIRSIQTTKKITHAMRLISMSFYNKLDKTDVPLKNYANVLRKVFIEVLEFAPEWRSPLLFPQDVFDSRPLFIVIATSKGLCGSLNSNLFRYIDTSLFIEKQQTPRFIAIGQKAIAYVKEKNIGELVCSYSELNSNNFITIADDLIDKIVNSPEPYTSVSFFSSYAKSFFLQVPYKTTLIPMKKESLASQQSGVVSEIPAEASNNNQSAQLWEQNKRDVLDYLTIRYLRSSIISTIFQALRAEHAARFLAMENSTTNAEKYLERLTLQFNKLRQSLITREVAELSSGFPVR